MLFGKYIGDVKITIWKGVGLLKRILMVIPIITFSFTLLFSGSKDNSTQQIKKFSIEKQYYSEPGGGGL